MKSYVRLTEPMVRENGTLRTATWDEALDRAAEGFRKVRDEHGGGGDRPLLLLEGDQRGELPRAEVRPVGPRHRTTSTAATAPDTPPASSV